VRILVVSNGIPPHGRYGTEFYTGELVRGLIGRGHQVAVLFPDRTGRLERYAMERHQQDGAELFVLHNPGDPLKRFATSYADPEVDRRFVEIMESWRPDICHFTYLLWGLSVRMPVIARKAGTPSVATLTDYGLLCHRGQMFDWNLRMCNGPHPASVCAHCIREPLPYDGSSLTRPGKRIVAHALATLGGMGLVPTTRSVERREVLVRESLQALAGVIAPSPSMEAVFMGAGVDPGQITALPYSFDPEPYAPARAEPDGDVVRLGFMGQLAPHKGLGTLLQAARILAERRGSELPDWELVIHGDAHAGRHRGYAADLLDGDLGAPVRVEGPFPSSEAPEHLAPLAAILVPSEWDENTPLIALQARAAGIPILASDVPGIAHLLDRPSRGRAVPIGDAAALATAMEDVIEGRLGRDPDPSLPLSMEEHLNGIEAIHQQAIASMKEGNA